MGHAYQLHLQLAAESTILLAQVDHLQHFFETEQVYVSVDLTACFFFASDDDSNIAITSQLEQAVQV
jgi:iron(III) transport system ATP-binding protein